MVAAPSSALAAGMADSVRSPERGAGMAGRSGYLPVSEHGLIGDLQPIHERAWSS